MHKFSIGLVSFLQTALVGMFMIAPPVAWAQDAQEQSSGGGIVHEYSSDSLSFSMIFPENWEVSKDTAGLEFFAEPKEKSQPSKIKPVVTDPNITVAASKNPMPIDEKSLVDYGALIETGLKKTVGEDANLEIFMKKIVDVSDTRKGLLYYLRYSKGDYQVFNAILVVSSETHVFRVTLTDYEVTFDANLERLYPFMASINVGPGFLERPTLVELATPWIAIFIGILVVLLAGRFVMLRMAQSRLSHNLNESAYESESSIAPMSRAVHFKTAPGSVYDPEFQESHDVSGYDGDHTEVPLSQALGESSGSFLGRGPKKSVTDPESEFGMASHSPIAMSHADSEMPTKRIPNKVTPPPPPRAPIAGRAASAAPDMKTLKASQPPPPPQAAASSIPTTRSMKADPSAMSKVSASEKPASATEFALTRAPDDDDV